MLELQSFVLEADRWFTVKDDEGCSLEDRQRPWWQELGSALFLAVYYVSGSGRSRGIGTRGFNAQVVEGGVDNGLTFLQPHVGTMDH